MEKIVSNMILNIGKQYKMYIGCYTEEVKKRVNGLEKVEALRYSLKP